MHLHSHAILKSIAVLAACALGTVVIASCASRAKPPVAVNPPAVTPAVPPADREGITLEKAPGPAPVAPDKTNGTPHAAAGTTGLNTKTVTPEVKRAGGKPSDAAARGIEDMFRYLDKNGDSKLTEEETSDAGLFKRMDSDRNNHVTLDEFKVEAEKMRKNVSSADVKAKFKELDTNGDGKLSPQEFPFPEMFRRLDANRDSVVTPDEVTALLGK